MQDETAVTLQRKMESLKQRENKLFKDWKESLPDNLKFIPDGVISENDGYFIENMKTYEYTGWKNVQCKILFLLKEANDEKTNNQTDKDFLKNSWDLRSFIFTGAIRDENNERKNKLTIGNISRWTYGIKELAKTGDIPDWKNANQRGNKVGRLTHLKSICAVNLNKQPGGASSKEKKIKEYFEKYNKPFLSSQLALYANSDIIICCGDIVKRLFVTLFKEIYGEEFKQQHVKMVDGVWTYQISNGPFIIGYYHPQQRSKNITNEVLYTRLTNTVKEIYK